jgi:hypothetical protein
VRRGLEERYPSSGPGQRRNVFCVDNKIYWEHRAKARGSSRPFLDLSGIIQLRKHCISIVSECQYRSATRYMNEDVPELLVQLQLWVGSSTANATEERRANIRQVVETIERQLMRDLMARTSQPNRVGPDTVRSFQDLIYNQQKLPQWSAAALSASSIWATWSPNTYIAFCSHHGIHSTRAQGYHNWNEEAMEGMIATVSPQWDRLCAIVSHQRSETKQYVTIVTDRAMDTLGKCP